jgi:hypothetical protein
LAQRLSGIPAVLGAADAPVLDLFRSDSAEKVEHVVGDH